jgi:hypothetical protein
VITDVVSTLKDMLDQLDNEIEEHTRQRDFCFVALANETEKPSARSRTIERYAAHRDCPHVMGHFRPSQHLPLWDVRSESPEDLESSSLEGMQDAPRLAQDKRSSES